MAGTYSFVVDVNRSFVTITIAGFFSTEEVMDFGKRRNEAFHRLESMPNQHVTLVDMQGMSIQPQAAVSAFATVLAEPRHQSRKLAFVVATSLARQQIERAAAGRDARFFSTIQEARRWLLSEGDVPGEGPSRSRSQISRPRAEERLHQA